MNEDIQDVSSGFEKSKERLEEIVTQVRAKDIPLAQSLDLFEEAIALGTKCASLIDNSDFSLAELGLLGGDEDVPLEDALQDEGETSAAEEVPVDGEDAPATDEEGPAADAD